MILTRGWHHDGLGPWPHRHTNGVTGLAPLAWRRIYRKILQRGEKYRDMETYAMLLVVMPQWRRCDAQINIIIEYLFSAFQV